jgi:acyl carrier protein
MSPAERPTRAEIEREIQSFVREALLEDAFEGVDPLAELDLDSLALEQLLDHLEETFRILFDPEDISRANLSSVARTADMVESRIVAVASGRRSW